MAADSTDVIGIGMAGSAADSVAMTEGSVAGVISAAVQMSGAVQMSAAEATSAAMAEQVSVAEAPSAAMPDQGEAVDSAVEANHEAVVVHTAAANRAAVAVDPTAAVGMADTGNSNFLSSDRNGWQHTLPAVFIFK